MADLTLAQKRAIAIAEASNRAAISNDPSIPQPMSQEKLAQANQQAQPNGIGNQIAEAISGGKSATMTDFLYGNKNPSKSTLGKIGQIIEASGVEGLTGIGTLGRVENVMPYIAKNIPAMPAVSKGLSAATEGVKSIPSRMLSFMSGKDPKAIETAYNVAKSGDPVLKKAYEKGLKLQDKLYSRMAYNYSRALGLPHEEALKAVHYSQDVEGGAWNLWNKYVKDFPDVPPPYSKFTAADPSQKIKLAEQAGVDLGRWSPLPPKTDRHISRSDLYDMAKWAIPFIPDAFSSIALKSPRVAGLLATGAGNTARYARKASDLAGSGYDMLFPSLQNNYPSYAGGLASLLNLDENN